MGSIPLVNAEWQVWLSTNAQRGCSPASMIEEMVKAGFAPATATAMVQGVSRPSSAASPATAATVATLAAVTPSAYRYDAAPVAQGNSVRIGEHEIKVLLRCQRPQVVVFGEVLTPDECNEMIERSRHRLQRSTIVDPVTGRQDVIPNRTSAGIWFQRGEDAFIDRLEQRIASLMNWPLDHGEGLQVMHYQVGGEYRPHFDYFPPDQAGSAVHTTRVGQRVATLIMYLNDVPDGGETLFPEAGISVVPKQGGAVYFRYLNGLRQLDPLSLHGGEPVLGGEKWIMTKWVREHPYV
jgi:prolyl 4-hydroxylase